MRHHPGREAPRVIQLVGIESPGLTAAGAIAGRVAGLVGEVLGGYWQVTGDRWPVKKE